MPEIDTSTRWLGSFRRTLRFLGPHRRTLILGLLAALGVGVFYTGSLSSIIPALKILFSDHETLADWLARNEAEHRLGVAFAADLPADQIGLPIRRATDDTSPLHAGAILVGITDEGIAKHTLANGEQDHPIRAPVDLTRVIADHVDAEIQAVLRDVDGRESTVSLSLREQRFWWPPLFNAASLLPAGRTPDDRFLTLVIVVGAIVAIGVLGSLFRFVNEALVAIAVQRAMHDLRIRLAERVLRLPVAWHNQHPSGDVLGRFTNDLNRVEVGLWTLFGKTIREPLKALGVLGVTLLIDWRILLIAGLGLPVAALVIRGFGRFVKRAQKRASQSWGVLLDQLGERLSGIRIVKANNMERAESERFSNQGLKLARAQMNIEVADAATKPSLETLALLAVGGFILYGGSRVFNAEVEPHLFIAAVVCLAGTFDPVRKLGNVNNRLQAADLAASRVFELIDKPIEAELPDPAPDARRASDLLEAPGIRFEHVFFRYPGSAEQHALRDISLTVEQGQCVAIVGPNGSGKTTLISLLLRFFEPESGRILLNGRNLRDFPHEQLREHFGYVSQDATIFSGTVRDAIGYGGDISDEGALDRAIRLAHLDDFLAQLQREHAGVVSSGLDAHISAAQLSGGQRQRLALARAILRDPPILIFDEATSQVDAESEHRIQEAIADVITDRTTLIIAHRFSTIARADRVIVLDRGEIIGDGAHHELIDTCPPYAALCQTQLVHET